MATSVYSWSTTAGTNATADSNINWAEGQLPSTVNDSARAMMAALAAMLRDQGGYAATAGAANAYTLALSQTMSAAVPALIGFRADRNNTGAATLNVDSLGAFPLRAVTGVALAADDIVSGCNYVVTWNSTSSEWLLINPRSVNLPASSKLGTPASGTLTNCTGLPVSTGVSGLGTGIATALAVNTGSAGAPVLFNGGLGTPSSGTLTNCTGLPTAGMVDNAVTTIKITDANVTPAKLSQPFTLATAVTTSGAATYDITGIPSWAKKITVQLLGVSTNGSGIVGIRVGNGSIVSTGYSSSASVIDTAVASTTSTTYHPFYFQANDTSSAARNGICHLENINGNDWVISHVMGISGTAATSHGASKISLGSALDRVRIMNSTGDTFDAGTFNISYIG